MEDEEGNVEKKVKEKWGSKGIPDGAGEEDGERGVGEEKAMSDGRSKLGLMIP